MFLSRFFVEGMVVERRDSCGGRYAPEPPVAKPCSCGATVGVIQPRSRGFVAVARCFSAALFLKLTFSNRPSPHNIHLCSISHMTGVARHICCYNKGQ